ncbi:protein FAM221B isoform X2 [Peromyscus californicus insignis]|uniref:protein FAM221B isoform X2 n=1 Tax=Peromyscus californicus insignis TaxID=564181 RepID=UPI0022A77CFF|nr:protein FAM221B isoform X2 [Peromyscus californicus insignis]
MEANETTEDPQDTTDAKERSSLKNPSAEDLREPTSLNSPLELSSSQTSSQPPAADVLFLTSISPNPETEASEDLQEPSVSGSTLKSHSTRLPSESPQGSSESLLNSPQSVTSLEKAITEIPLEDATDEIHISKVRNNALQLSQKKDVPASSRRLYSDAGPRTQVPESEHSPKYSFAGPSTQDNVDTSAKWEETEKDELIVGTSDDTAHAAKPEPHASKKEKRIGGYTSRPAIPAKRAELMNVAKPVNREQFGARVKNLFQWEKDSALKAIQTGLYIGWRCPHYLWDCFRIGDESKCFCGHLLKEHQIISDLSVPCSVSQCRCLMFCFIPSRPEEVGEFWLKRRATFDPKAWRAQCRCKHTHEEHAATGAHPCRHRGCCCSCFESNFLCAACDRRWEEHETFFENEETRRRGGRPYGADYVPFAEMPALRDAILTNSDLEALQMQGVSGHPSSHPRSLAPPGPSHLQPGPKSNPHP